MLKGDVQLEEGPLKKNVDSIVFVYVEGIFKMKYALARGILRSTGVNMQAIRDTSFLGSRVCSFLVDRDYKEKKDIEPYIQPGLQGEHNILDAALNDAKIWRIPEV